MVGGELWEVSLVGVLVGLLGAPRAGVSARRGRIARGPMVM